MPLHRFNRRNLLQVRLNRLQMSATLHVGFGRRLKEEVTVEPVSPRLELIEKRASRVPESNHPVLGS